MSSSRAKGLKWSGRETYLLLPSRTEVESVWSCPYIPSWVFMSLCLFKHRNLPVTFSSSNLFCLSILSVEDYCCIWSHTDTHTHTHTKQDYPGRVIGLSQRPLLDYNQYSTRDKYVFMPPAALEPAIRAREWTYTHALDRAATGISPSSFYKEKCRDLNR